MEIQFLGAAETVTGSKYLIKNENEQFLVDCGLFQGVKKLRQMNWEYLPIQAEHLDAVFLTHGHLDHVGYLPKLIKMGFKGPIYGTEPTLKIAEIILEDSAKIQEEEAERANKEEYSKHSPAEPLYTIKDAEKAISYFKVVPEGSWFDFSADLKFRFQTVGHIIGACFLEIEFKGKILVFSGDIGRADDLLMYPPKKPKHADILFMESTYGNRHHIEEDVEQILQDLVVDTVNKGGALIIPSFAVERAQTIMYLLWKLASKGKIPKIPMFLDSPMGAGVLKIFEQFEEWHKLDKMEVYQMVEQFTVVQEFRETWEVIDLKGPKIVIAGSGMLTGGRVLTYLKQLLQKDSTNVLLVGYQAEGTRGRYLLEGADEIKIYGKYIPVNATIHSCNSLSAHGDQQDLLDWLSDLDQAPEKIYIIHGELCAADEMRRKIRDVYGWEATIPQLYQIDEF
ncbi:MAG: MBL fold metallo-hydrolase [Flavobacteriales bacterium]|nr:MBL fold metallo-hydrolase [Flavobacteriales bacterium]